MAEHDEMMHGSNEYPLDISLSKNTGNVSNKIDNKAKKIKSIGEIPRFLLHIELKLQQCVFQVFLAC